MNSVAITGATGYPGRELSRRLLERGLANAVANPPPAGTIRVLEVAEIRAT